MKKRNVWPVGITAFLILFVGVVVVGGILVSRINYDLVRADYYSEEIGYEAHLASIRRADALREKPSFTSLGRSLRVQFPPALAKRATHVTVHLYYPAGKESDIHASLDLSQGPVAEVPLQEQPGGNWRVTLAWLEQDLEYRITRKERFVAP